MAADIVVIFEEVLDAAAVLDDIDDAARATAWASSVLGVWGEDPDAGGIDREFVRWLAEADHPNASSVIAALRGVLDVAGLDELAAGNGDRPGWAAHVAVAEATRAWEVRQGDASSIGLGFRFGDGSELSLLADIDEGTLLSLICAPGPDELFDGSEDVVAPEARNMDDAAAAMVAAWERLLDEGGAPPESVHVNGAIACRLLGDCTGAELGHLFRPAVGVEVEPDGLDPEERAELDAWALSVLDGAGVGSGTPGPSALLDPLVPARTAAYPATEREAFAALEWADWLGAVIELTRLAVATRVEAGLLVDLINRCPEVTSSIPRRDRPYYEWAFSLVLPLWRRAGVLDSDDRLTEDGAAHLVAALRTAWGPPGDRAMPGSVRQQ